MFNFFDNNQEYDLYNNMSAECVDLYGAPVKYLPRTLVNPDYILGEDTLSQFNQAIDMKLYLESYTEFAGQNDLYGKFGFQVDDRQTWTAQIDYVDNLLGGKPQVSDLIYFEFADKIMEIKHIEDEHTAFYIFGKKMVYKFDVVEFEYSHEDFNTGNTDIDAVENLFDINNSDESDEFDAQKSDVLNFDENNIFGNIE
ncbi:hypothetical protein [uncultured Arcobacter sp.]|uniref:hypothetical protein n=1 Tax=uncultured Arcobacter sp. TaxID=165434 RepID=UPI00262134BB|nr:hypothetical protein [uncultured Arcobacter sp.]